MHTRLLTLALFEGPRCVKINNWNCFYCCCFFLVHRSFNVVWLLNTLKRSCIICYVWLMCIVREIIIIIIRILMWVVRVFCFSCTSDTHAVGSTLSKVACRKRVPLIENEKGREVADIFFCLGLLCVQWTCWKGGTGFYCQACCVPRAEFGLVFHSNVGSQWHQISYHLETVSKCCLVFSRDLRLSFDRPLPAGFSSSSFFLRACFTDRCLLQ